MGVVIHNINVGSGDCLLILSNQYKILVDCGKYNNNVKKVFSDNNVESLDLVIATHIDDDHIGGLCEVLNEVDVKNIIFNGFHHIPIPDSKNPRVHISSEIISKLKDYNSYWGLRPFFEGEVSAKKSLSLSEVIQSKKIPWNICTGGSCISVDNKQRLTLGDLNITVLSPDNKALINTYNAYRKFIFEKTGHVLDADNKEDIAISLYDIVRQAHQLHIDEYEISHYAGLSKKMIIDHVNYSGPLDSSESNMASLAFILEIEGKRILFLGDAHPNIVLKGFDELHINELDTFDAIKVAHHGSCKNTTNELLERIDSSRYIFCGGGSQKPSEYTISKIIRRSTDSARILYFNKPNNVVDNFSRATHIQDEFKFQIDTTTNKIEL